MTINFNSLNSLSAFGKEVIKVFLNDEIIWQKDTPLCFTAKEPNVKITFDANGNWPTDYNYLEYSTDGNNWDDYTGQEITLASTGDKVYFNTPDDITNHTWGNVYPFSFTSNGQYAASGNIMSLVVKDGKTDRIPEDFYFQGLFNKNKFLTKAPSLPATTIAKCCYQNMFRDCTSLSSASTLPAETLADWCYSYMFYGCTSLSSAPTLPAETLAGNCYNNMFRNCTSLTSAPDLSAKTLVYGCYQNMFRDCTSLSSAPALLATTLAGNCYSYMFQGCTALSSAPDLSVQTLVDLCYQNMFRDCTSLSAAPALPAETLATNCYSYMFQGCNKLSSIEVNHTEWNPSDATTSWVQGVASTGTFKCPAELPQIQDESHIPTGWSIA